MNPGHHIDYKQLRKANLKTARLTMNSYLESVSGNISRIVQMTRNSISPDRSRSAAKHNYWMRPWVLCITIIMYVNIPSLITSP